MSKMVLKILMIISVVMLLSCGSGNAEKPQQAQGEIVDTVNASILGTVNGDKIIIIDKDVDLKGNVCKISSNKILVFKGGLIKNGVLLGNMTKIECKGKAFDKVTIKGSWNVQEISTKFFADLSYENSLQDVVALANPKVKNRIVIEKGDYQVRASEKAKVCIPICSNTEVILNGTIRLEPNDLKSYHIIRVKGKNIKIKGCGTIIGDKHIHTGKEGEWGMGINLKGAINATISGLTIKDCWGDCIYVGGNSRNVIIESCKIDGGRRQGISVTRANGVTIRNCTITNVSGTNPQYAIDIEPNKRDSVDNILIDNVKVRDCEGGFLVVHGAPKDGAKTPWTGTVTIRRCNVKCQKKNPIRVVRCKRIEIDRCTLYTPDGLSAIAVTGADYAIVQNNNISVFFSLLDKAKEELREFVGKGKRMPIDIRKTRKQSVKNNRSIAREE